MPALGQIQSLSWAFSGYQCWEVLGSLAALDFQGWIFTFPSWKFFPVMPMLRSQKDPAGVEREELSGGRGRWGRECFSELIQGCFLIKNLKKKKWRENEIKVKDKKNLLKAGQTYHANKDLKWKIKKITKKEKRSKKVASIKSKLLSQSWKEFRREGFFFFFPNRFFSVNNRWNRNQ